MLVVHVSLEVYTKDDEAEALVKARTSIRAQEWRVIWTAGKQVSAGLGAASR